MSWPRTSEDAATLLGISPAVLRNVVFQAGLSGTKPGAAIDWNLSRLTGLIVFRLARDILRANATDRRKLLKWFWGTHPEHLEAVIRGGRRHLICVRGRLCPDLLPWSAVELMDRERGEVLRSLGVEIVALDVGEVFSKLQSGLSDQADEHRINYPGQPGGGSDVVTKSEATAE
jgi:hypothetical protein